MWFQHDGSPAHNERNALQYLDDTFTNQWIGRNSQVSWPARSPDLSPWISSLGGSLQSWCMKLLWNLKWIVWPLTRVAAGDVVGNLWLQSRVRGGVSSALKQEADILNNYCSLIMSIIQFFPNILVIYHTKCHALKSKIFNTLKPSILVN